MRLFDAIGVLVLLHKEPQQHQRLQRTSFFADRAKKLHQSSSTQVELRGTMQAYAYILAWSLLPLELTAFVPAGGHSLSLSQQSFVSPQSARTHRPGRPQHESRLLFKSDGRSAAVRRVAMTMDGIAQSTVQTDSGVTVATDRRKKVVVIGAGWAGLAAAYELSKQREDFDVTLLEGGKSVGGLVAGWKTPGGRPVEAGVHGFWYPYRNIFRLIEEELNVDPFTPWTQSAQYSPEGLEVISPIFQNMPRLPSPLGTFLYPSFLRLPWSDRLTALGVLASVVDWDNTPEAWRKYDKYTARELFRTMGCSERLYKDAFEPMLLVGLFAPGEQCSAAGALGMLYFFILAHQADFDVKWCRGTTGEMIFKPWVKKIEDNGARVLVEKRVTDIEVNPVSGDVTSVVCGDESFPADAVVSAVGINGVKGIVRAAPGLSRLPFFSRMMNLRSVDALAVRLYLDRRVRIPYQSNACFGFDKTTGWTFFDLTAMHDSLGNSTGTVLEADFYHADQLLPQSDKDLVAKVQRDIATCVPGVGRAKVIDYSVVRIAQGVTHFSPGSYGSMPTCGTPVPNMFMSGDWIVNDHGSFSQEKAFVTGIEAANAVVKRLGVGRPGDIIPLEADEPHIQAARAVNDRAKKAIQSLPGAQWLLP